VEVAMSCGRRIDERVAELQREVKFAEGYLKRHPMRRGRAMGNLEFAKGYLGGAMVTCNTCVM
jgi:hypothetical protein